MNGEATALVTKPVEAEGHKTHESVEEYYGRVLKKTGDLKTNACCSGADLPAKHKEVSGRYVASFAKRCALDTGFCP